MEAAPTTDVLSAVGARLAVGGGLFYGVTKFFEKVEEKLADETKLEIAAWLLDVKTEERVRHWPDTFAAVFDRVFGKRGFSWPGLTRSAVATTVMALLGALVFMIWIGALPARLGSLFLFPLFWLSMVVSNILPAYISLLATRTWIGVLSRKRGTRWTMAIVLLPLVSSLALATVSMVVGTVIAIGFIKPVLHVSTDSTLLFSLAAIFGSILASLVAALWLWLYAVSGFLLKAARRVDLGFGWFNRRRDIEKKPLSSIGLIAGALCALVYWAWCMGAAVLWS